MTKSLKMAIALAAIACGLPAARAHAQTSQEYGAVNPTTYVDYYAGDDTTKSPSDKAPVAPTPATPAPATPAPAAPAPAAAPAATATDAGSSDSKTCDPCKLDCKAQDVKHLFDPDCHPWMKCENIAVSGWVEAGIMFHDGQRNPDGFNGVDGFNDRDSEFQANQIYTIIQKTLKNTECCPDWGWDIDLLYGTDARFPLSRGLDARDNGVPKWNTDPRYFYDLAMPQAYVEYGTTRMDWKVGHFYTLLGNEVVPATQNVFYSHTYTFLYAYPFTHTGFMGTWTPNDQFKVVGGLNMGWDDFNDEDENVSFTGQTVFTSKDKNTTLTWSFQDGNEPLSAESNPATGPYRNRYIQSIVLAHTLNDRLSYVLESPFGIQSNGSTNPVTGRAQNATWYGMDGYAVYKLNCCWNSALRFEWFRDTEGTRVVPPGDFLGNNVASAGGFAGNFYDVTAGLQYHPNGNLMIRPELRYDWFDGQDRNGVAPYHAGTSNHQWITGIDAILQF